MSPTTTPSRGEVWLADLDPTEGREQRGTRPCLIVSADPINEGPAGLVTVVPLTTTRRGVPSHVLVEPPEGGLDRPSVAMCEQIRTISKGRLTQAFNSVRPETMTQVDEALRLILDL